IFSSNRDGLFNLYRKPANGAKEEEVLLRSNENKAAMSWSRDGRFLLYSSSKSPALVNQDLWVLPLEGNRTPFPFLQTRFDEGFGFFSPDGRWVSYRSNETGDPEIYLRPFIASPTSPAGTGKWIVSNGGAQNLSRWRDDGKELIYENLQGALMSVS